MLINTCHPESEEAISIAESLSEKYSATVKAVDCSTIDEQKIKVILGEILKDFPIREIEIKLPNWLAALPLEHWLRKSIIDAIGSSVTSPEKLIGTHIFNYHQNPNTLTTTETFITIQVHIPQSYYRNNNVYVKPTIEIWIISHERHMNVDNIPKITDNRNDYLSKLIDEKLNGRTDLGFGKLTLISNVEGAYQSDYLFRQMIFEGTDLNDSLCYKED